MAEITLLTPVQLAERDQPTGPGRSGRRRSAERTRIIGEYKAAMQDAGPGYGADVLLGAGEEKRVVRLNLKAAADELNLALEFRPIKDSTRMHFRFITPEAQAARPKRGGRPRKQRPAAPAAPEDAPAQNVDPAPAPTTGDPDASTAPPTQRTRRSRAA